MHLIESFIRNPVKVTVGVLLVALFGTAASIEQAGAWGRDADRQPGRRD